MNGVLMQRLVAAAIVLGALAFLVRRGYRAYAASRARTSSGCGPGCGCGH
jgi:hypothetical protein